MLDIADFIQVRTQITPGVPASAIGQCLFLTKDDALDAGGAGKVKQYSNLSAVGEDFATTDESYLVAQVYFAQAPYPKPLLAGRWAEVAANHEIRGGAPAANTVIAASAVNDGSLRFEETDIEGVTFVQNATTAAIAAALQTAIRAATTAWGSVTVTYGSGRYTVEVPPGVSVTGVFSAHSQGTGTDLSQDMGLDSDSGTTLHLGSEVETITEALDNIREQDDAWSIFFLEKSLNGETEMAEASAWVAGQRKIFAGESNERAALTAGETGTVAATVAALQSPRTFLTWSATADYKAASISARFAGLDLTAGDPLITAKFKALPGTLVDKLSSGEKAELDRKRINAYVQYGQTNMYAEGFNLAPTGWIDVQFWLDWFNNEVASRLFAHLVSAPKVSQTDVDVAGLVEIIEAVCEIGVTNGGIAPGEASASMAAAIRQRTRDNDFDGTLSTGYIVYAGPVGEQSSSDREARKGPPLYTWLKGGGAIHNINVFATFEQ